MFSLQLNFGDVDFLGFLIVLGWFIFFYVKKSYLKEKVTCNTRK